MHGLTGKERAYKEQAFPATEPENHELKQSHYSGSRKYPK
jgi:hypothetical protein